MKKEELPQDLGALGKITKEVCYVVDKDGSYKTELSNGWEIKANALDVAWQDIEKRVRAAKLKVAAGEMSPVYLYMEEKLMDCTILAQYTGFWKWQVKRHMKPSVFAKLSRKKLEKYAEVFEISVDDLQNPLMNEA